MTSRKDWKPDFGLYLAGRELGDKVFAMPNFPMTSLAVRGPGEYSIGANTTVDGQEYAATFDFEQEAFEGLLSSLPDYISDGLRPLVEGIEEFPAIIRFPDPITVVIEARLGSVAHGDGEDFIPLVAHSVEYSG